MFEQSEMLIEYMDPHPTPSPFPSGNAGYGNISRLKDHSGRNGRHCTRFVPASVISRDFFVNMGFEGAICDILVFPAG